MNDAEKKAHAIAKQVEALCPTLKIDVMQAYEVDFESETDTEFLVVVGDDEAIVDPYSDGNGCPCEPSEHGLTNAAADLIRAHNRVTF